MFSPPLLFVMYSVYGLYAKRFCDKVITTELQLQIQATNKLDAIESSYLQMGLSQLLQLDVIFSAVSLL